MYINPLLFTKSRNSALAKMKSITALATALMLAFTTSTALPVRGLCFVTVIVMQILINIDSNLQTTGPVEAVTKPPSNETFSGV